VPRPRRRDPDVVTACVGGGSNAIGIFSGFVDTDADLVGVEPAGGAAVGRGVPGIVHGSTSFLLQDDHGQVQEAESISAGLDYPGVGPEHAHLAELGRARYESVTDAEVLDAFQLLSRTEGIIPALEPAHALAWVSRARAELAGKTVLLNLSGRGDKDVAQVGSEAALAAGADLDTCLGVLGEITVTTGLPSLAMTYANPVFRRGSTAFWLRSPNGGWTG
jgi:tryptophan synthase beta chain